MTRGPRASVFGPRDEAAASGENTDHLNAISRMKKPRRQMPGGAFVLRRSLAVRNSASGWHARFIALVAHPIGKFGIGFPTMAGRRFADIGNGVRQRGDAARAHPDGFACWRVCFGQQVINVYLVR